MVHNQTNPQHHHHGRHFRVGLLGKTSRLVVITLKHKGSYEPVYAGHLGLISVKTKPYFATANCPTRPTASFPRRRESRGIHRVPQVRVLPTAPQRSTPTAHTVARSGFPPARERQVGEAHARRGLASDGGSGLIYFKTKLYLATANHPPHPTPSFPRRRESRGIHSVPQVRVLPTAPQRSTPTAHAVARSGFPPARGRHVR